VGNKSKNFYYTFPGSRHANQQRRLRQWMAGIVVGLLTAGLLAGICYALQM